MRLLRFIITTVMLCTAIVQASAGRKDRGITSLDGDRTPFLEKGGWTIGGTANVSSYGINNYGISVIKCAGGSGYGISVKPGFMYAVKNDLMLGARFSYKRDKMDLEGTGLSIGQISLDVKEYNYITQDFGGEFLLRKYLPLGNSGRFSIFIDGSIGLSGGQSKVTNKEEKGIVGSYQTSFSAGLNLNPGLAMFVTRHLVLDIGLGLLGINYSWANQIHNQIESGNNNGFGASYIVNPLALSFGIHYSF